MIKKLLALTLTFLVVLSAVGCTENPNQTAKDDPSSHLPPINEVIDSLFEETPDALNEVVSQLEEKLPESFEDFKNLLDRDLSVKTESDKDGNLKVELELSTTGDGGNTPAVPTIDRLPVKPEEKEEKPQENKEENKEFEIEIEVEIEPNEPEPTPEEDVPSLPEVTEPEKAPESLPEQTPERPEKPEYTYTEGQIHKALPVTSRYLYSLLDTKQRATYLAIDKAVKNLEDIVAVNYNISANREYYVYYMYMFDNPEHFYLANTVTVYNRGDGTGELRLSYSVGKEAGEKSGYGIGALTEELKAKIRAKKAEFDTKVQKIISTIPANAPAVVKEKLIYDRILRDSHYNLGARWDGLANDNWTAYGIIVNTYGVCESYSEAFQTLCLAVGINCTGVVGTAGGGHKWNAVQLDGEWYMCDITFDDPIGSSPDDAYHYYFNLTSKEMRDDGHSWTNDDYPVPECNGTKYSYKNYFE